jgi:hypothetical protein
LNTLGVKELGSSQLVDINGGGPVEEMVWRAFLLLVDAIKTFGPSINQANCERPTRDNYQPYADIGHR